MKYVSITVLSFLYSTVLFGQQSVIVGGSELSSTSYLQTIDFGVFNFDEDFTFSLVLQNKRPNVFSVYDAGTGLNDIYSQNVNDLQLPIKVSRSIKLLENDTRAYKIDSFNPYGASSVGEGVLLGAINLLFKKRE